MFPRTPSLAPCCSVYTCLDTSYINKIQHHCYAEETQICVQLKTSEEGNFHQLCWNKVPGVPKLSPAERKQIIFAPPKYIPILQKHLGSLSTDVKPSARNHSNLHTFISSWSHYCCSFFHIRPVSASKLVAVNFRFHWSPLKLFMVFPVMLLNEPEPQILRQDSAGSSKVLVQD